MKWHDKNLPYHDEYDMDKFGKSEPGKIYHIEDKYIELPMRYDELIGTIRDYQLKSHLPNLDNDIMIATSLLNKQYITHEDHNKFKTIEKKVYDKMASIRDNSQSYRLLNMDMRDKQSREYFRKKKLATKPKRKTIKCSCKKK